MSKNQGLTNEQIQELREKTTIGDLLNYLANRPAGPEKFCGSSDEHLFLSNNGTWVDSKQKEKESECSGNTTDQTE